MDNPDLIEITFCLKKENELKFKELFEFLFLRVHYKKNIPHAKLKEIFELVQLKESLEYQSQQLKRQVLESKVYKQLDSVFNILNSIKKEKSTKYNFTKSKKIKPESVNDDEYDIPNAGRSTKVVYNLNDLIKKIADSYINLKLNYEDSSKKIKREDGAKLIKLTVDYLKQNKILTTENKRFATVIVSVFLLKNSELFINKKVDEISNEAFFQAAIKYYRYYNKNYLQNNLEL